MRRVFSTVVLLWLAAIHIGLAIAVCCTTGCQHQARHVDYVPAQPRREYHLPHYYPEPRQRLEREA